MSEPKPIDMVVQLRAALGLFDGAMPISPQQAWREALEIVHYHRSLAKVARDMAETVNGTLPPKPPVPSWSGLGDGS